MNFFSSWLYKYNVLAVTSFIVTMKRKSTISIKASNWNLFVIGVQTSLERRAWSVAGSWRTTGDNLFLSLVSGQTFVREVSETPESVGIRSVNIVSESGRTRTRQKFDFARGMCGLRGVPPECSDRTRKPRATTQQSGALTKRSMLRDQEVLTACKR